MNKQFREALLRAGAQQRYAVLKTELDTLVKAFPGLDGAVKSKRQVADKATDSPVRRKRMSAAERKAVGARMKKYWAERRKQAAKAAKE